MKRMALPGAVCGTLAVLWAALLGQTPALPQEKSGPLATASEVQPGSLRAKQQALFDRLNVAEAWKITRGDPKVVVGIIDSGFDYYHPDLQGQLIPGFYYPNSYHTEFYENVAHGTLVAGLIVAREDRPDGMVGLAPRCRALTVSQGMIEHVIAKFQVRFFQEHPRASYADFQKEMAQSEAVKKFQQDWVYFQVDGTTAAIRYLVDHGVRVINFSGGLLRSQCPSAEKWKRLEAAFSYAASKQVVIVLSAGNNAAQWEGYPGRPDTVIVAGASLLDDTRWEEEVSAQGTRVKLGSNYGTRLTAMAPIDQLLVCRPHERRFYSCDDGPMGPLSVPFKGMHELLPIGATSSAAPIVTSLVALIDSVRPRLSARSVVEIVQRGCDDIGEMGHDLRTGYGRINFGRSLQLARNWDERRSGKSK